MAEPSYALVDAVAAYEAAWVRRRAWDLVNEHRPQRAPTNDRPAT
jgi:hypothetical protein